MLSSSVHLLAKSSIYVHSNAVANAVDGKIADWAAAKYSMIACRFADLDSEDDGLSIGGDE